MDDQQNRPPVTKHESSSGEYFYGSQVARGGGHFTSDYDYNLDDVAASLNLEPGGEARAAAPEGDDFDMAFAPLRQASENAPSFRPLIDFLEQELRKGADTNDLAASSLVTSLLQLWPASLPLLRQLLTVSPTRESIGPITRTVIDQGV